MYQTITLLNCETMNQTITLLNFETMYQTITLLNFETMCQTIAVLSYEPIDVNVSNYCERWLFFKRPKEKFVKKSISFW